MSTRESVPEDEQLKVLDEAKNVVKAEGFQMKRCLDGGNLMDALKHASNMICELRTSLLSPKNYYVLYMEASDQLRYLESYLLEERQGKKMAELYELVQYAGNILPRLYLLITVGSVYIKLKEAPAKDVLRDIVEMCRGVQHPTRGLFLRTYLSEMVKDKLPDTGSEYEGRGGNVKDSVEFVLQNFTEMNKLWVRMQHQGPVREKEKRETERSELRLLVGKNIARLSQLEGVDLSLYSKAVLPKLVEQIVNCKDTIAQQYLMECIIQVFPDEYHLRNLESLLGACSQLQPTVNLKTILVSLIDRLANFAAASADNIPDDIKVFDIFSSQISSIVNNASTKIPLEDILALQASLLNLSITCYPKDLANVDQIFKFCGEILDKYPKEDQVKPSCVKQLLKLLSSPLDIFKNLLTVLELSNYGAILPYLEFANKKKVAIDICKTGIEYGHKIPTPAEVEKLLHLISPLIKDEDNVVEDKEEFEEEQNLVASLVHLFESDTEQTYGMLLTARRHFGQGGSQRIKHSLVPLVFSALKLTNRLKNSEEQDEDWAAKARKVFKFSLETVSALAKTELSQLSLHLFLQCAQAANKCGTQFETIAYEFITQAFVIYEEHITDSVSQFNSISLIIGTLRLMTVFGEDNYDTLVTKTAQHSSKLLKKPDQCRGVYMCSHLFWRTNVTPEFKNGKRVLECLQKSLKIADTCVDASMNIHLFIEILNEYLYYFEEKCDAVTVQYLSGLIALINNHLSNMASTEPSAALIHTHYQNTINFIKQKGQTEERYNFQI